MRKSVAIYWNLSLAFHLFLLFFTRFSDAAFGQTSTVKTQPNILYIMSDDHARQAISSYDQSLINTPNIDRLADEGVRFTNSFVTNSICAPSRAVLLTGKYSHQNGLRDNRDTFDGAQQTLPKLMRKAGYQTAMIGKWHLKSEPTGFDTWEILRGQGEYYNPYFLTPEGKKQIPGYATDVITDRAIETLKKRDKNKPFMMFVHHKAPHREWLPNLKHLGLFTDTKFPLPETFYDDYKGRIAAKEADMRIDDMFLYSDFKLQDEDFEVETGSGGKGSAVPRLKINNRKQLTAEQLKVWDSYYDKMRAEYREANLSGKELLEWKYQRYMQDYLRCIVSVDENVGRLLDYLDANGLAKNTIVVYTSDQGFYLGEHGWYDKRFMYEESLSMPLLVRYPKQIEAGQISDDIVLNLDFAPTFLDYAGASIPDDFQGETIRPVLQGETPVNWRTSMYYHYYEYPHGWHRVKRHYGVRTQHYKLIHFYNDIDAWELFDLRSDPTEIRNLIDDPAYAGMVAELKVELNRLQVKYQEILE